MAARAAPDPHAAPDREVDLACDLSIAFLVLLERLGPEERAAFLLHEVFDRGYDEIAEALGKSEAACRQVVHRARQRVRRDGPRFHATDEIERAFSDSSPKPWRHETSRRCSRCSRPTPRGPDGGGRVPAPPCPIVGAERLVKLVIGLQERFYRNRTTLHLALINGEPGLCVRMVGQVIGVIAVECDSERIHAVYGVVNPDKLGDVRHFH